MNDSLREPERLGSPIVALHSFASANSQWDKLQIELENRAQVHAIDLPEPGAIGDLEDSITCSELTIQHLQRKIASDGSKIHLIGHSSAGSAALKLALQYPEMFKSITVYEPTVFHIADTGNRIGNKLRQEFEFMKDALLQSRSGGTFDAGIEQFWKFWDSTEFWQQFSSEEKKEFSSKIEFVVSEIESCFSDNWWLEDLQSLDVPVQVIMGMQSPLVFQNLAVQIVSALLAGRLTTLPMYGHFAPITHPEVINPLIIDHICDAEHRQVGKKPEGNLPTGERSSDREKKAGILNRIRNSSFSFFS